MASSDAPTGGSKASASELSALVLDRSAHLAQRMRAVFELRTMGGEAAVQCLCAAVEDVEGSCLFRHEVAFVLGQMGDEGAVPALTGILKDTSQDAIVRHEVSERVSSVIQFVVYDLLSVRLHFKSA